MLKENLKEYSICFIRIMLGIKRPVGKKKKRVKSKKRGASEKTFWRAHICECARACVYLFVLVCMWGNWMTACLSLQSHSTALEWHCRWMSLKCFSELANSAAETDAKADISCNCYLLNFGD